IEKVDSFIESNPFSMLYLSRNNCSVCHDLLPKIRTMAADFPQLQLGFINADVVEDVASKFTVFSVPTVFLFVEGKEFLRESRFIRVQQLKEMIEKIYKLYYR